ALPPTYLPFTGAIKSELVPFYRAMLKYMRARGIRAGVLGISKGGTVLATNGYGYRDAGLDADPFVNAGEGGPLVQPDAPFRIASVTKPLTAAAVRDAAADNGVPMNSPAAPWVGQSLNFSFINGFPPLNYNVTPSGTDPRWANLTIQHVLNHHVGFWRDSALPGNNGLPAYNSGKLPFTVNPNDPNNPNDFQPALTGFSSDISYTTSYVLAGLQLASDPRPTVARTILFAAGNTFQYPPGGNVGQGDNYANIGYMLAGRVLEGLRGEDYDPDDPEVPEGWGKFPKLLQNYLCEASGIQTGVYPGDTFHPYAGEPYYRDIDEDGNEEWEWNLAGGSERIRYNNQAQIWEFCQSGCGAPGAVWSTSANTPSPYGGIWLAQRNSAGGIVATTTALLKFARNHRVKVGTPFEGAAGTGSLLAAPGAYGSSSSHNGSLPGTRAWLWQMGGARNNRLPFEWRAWNPDPAAPLDLDENGNVLVDEATLIASSCVLPSDVAVAVIFNQRQDRRAPSSGGVGNSTNGRVYGRIADFLGDAVCQVIAGEGWPGFGEAPAQLAVQPSCN
ncbi:MAG TPA: serine hydrolase domain-containing protein, partial [Candidatus Polarisedimenticolaceae bacterium]|nr:serine hydrolase domain-containing protein [Candidatus Polarisedimenticolaceae bacterium]